MKYMDGDSYGGEWKNNLFHGIGRFKWKTGNVYFGNWKDGKRDGKGTFYWVQFVLNSVADFVPSAMVMCMMETG